MKNLLITASIAALTAGAAIAEAPESPKNYCIEYAFNLYEKSDMLKRQINEIAYSAESMEEQEMVYKLMFYGEEKIIKYNGEIEIFRGGSLKGCPNLAKAFFEYETRFDVLDTIMKHKMLK